MNQIIISDYWQNHVAYIIIGIINLLIFTNLNFIELTNTRARVEKWNADNSNNDRLVRELQAQVDDLTEAAAAKDSQLAVLKVRLQEADQLLSSRNKALEILQNEKSRYSASITSLYYWRDRAI